MFFVYGVVAIYLSTRMFLNILLVREVIKCLKLKLEKVHPQNINNEDDMSDGHLLQNDTNEVKSDIVQWTKTRNRYVFDFLFCCLVCVIIICIVDKYLYSVLTLWN
jgi:hypothetical protein